MSNAARNTLTLSRQINKAVTAFLAKQISYNEMTSRQAELYAEADRRGVAGHVSDVVLGVRKEADIRFIV